MQVLKKNNNDQFQIKPKQKDKIKTSKVKEIIREVLVKSLEKQTFVDIAQASKETADMIKYKLKDNESKRFKFIVLIGELKGQGVQVGGKCFWDFQSDTQVFETFYNEHIYCLVNVYSIYLY